MSKVNEELIFLYFNVGQEVSAKVSNGIWGEGTIDELASHIAVKLPGIGGFNRRGLYRMKQFYEAYSLGSDCFQLWLNVKDTGQNLIDTPVVGQSQNSDNQRYIFVSTVLTQIQWSSHLHILSKTKTPEEKLFYLLLAKKERLSVRELERQLNS
ncbi:MAG: DUF1016 N-terminal domain-containing protein, partial [Bacteroidia bacterium]|nr:DUF1016 N-terminal domain-containing protein [Bacteroidia bacterium]